MSESVILRPARPEDATKAAELIYTTGPKSFNLAFGSYDRAIALIRRMFAEQDTIMSFNQATVAEFEGQTVGVLVLLDRKIERRTQARTGVELLKLSGPLFILFRFPVYLRQGRLILPIPPDTLFIADVAVSANFQGKGIGRLLMKHAESVAVQKDYTSLCLDVAKDNFPAISLYKRLGYIRIFEATDPWFNMRFGLSGFQRMSKRI
ncbi:GNAT family N-acetyltransferase [candidate division WOR-3 bacterium]|nr:GNAT family N-acetyltransferase [candidate division WOR-3 bacterium]